MTRPSPPAVVVIGDLHPLVGVRFCSICGEEAKGRRGVVLQLQEVTPGTVCPQVCETCVADCVGALEAERPYATGAEFLAAADALKLTGDLDEVNADQPEPSLRLVVVPNSQLPDALSLRPMGADGKATGHLKEELCDAGFKAGDRVEVVLLRRAENCQDCADATGGVCRRHQEAECTCYELTGGHQPGCAFNGRPPGGRPLP